MADKESWSIWDHITGECFEGPFAGSQLEFWPVFLTTVGAAKEDYPDLTISLSNYRTSLKVWLLRFIHSRVDSKGFIPPHFFNTMSGPVDDRLDRLDQGLGVTEGKAAKYYPTAHIKRGETIEDEWLGRPLLIERRAKDGVLRASWKADGSMPMPLLSRWYGFSFTYPGCEIYEPTH